MIITRETPVTIWWVLEDAKELFEEQVRFANEPVVLRVDTEVDPPRIILDIDCTVDYALHALNHDPCTIAQYFPGVEDATEQIAEYE